MTALLDRYLAGEHKEVWRELRWRGADNARPPYSDEARAVARETVRKARHNVGLIHGRLLSLGYRFADPSQAFRLPDAKEAALLERIEAECGPLPLVMRAWYEAVGSVNFEQEEGQLTGQDGTGLTGFGFLKPLEVRGLDYLWENRQAREDFETKEPLVLLPTGECASNNELRGFYAPRLSADEDEYDGEGDGFVPHLRYMLKQGGFGRAGGLLERHEILLGVTRLYLRGGPLPDVERILPLLCAGLQPL